MILTMPGPAVLPDERWQISLCWQTELHPHLPAHNTHTRTHAHKHARTEYPEFIYSFTVIDITLIQTVCLTALLQLVHINVVIQSLDSISFTFLQCI